MSLYMCVFVCVCMCVCVCVCCGGHDRKRSLEHHLSKQKLVRSFKSHWRDVVVHIDFLIHWILVSVLWR